MGDVREKGLGPELHGDTGGDDHFRGSRNKKASDGQLGLGLTARANYSSSVGLFLKIRKQFDNRDFLGLRTWCGRIYDLCRLLVQPFHLIEKVAHCVHPVAYLN